mmetsp:Transcript_22690/g.73435  ORF Transcript_22690/g.73435 Transcript_22690/m.73435 type:complete len:318 (-) Transcript_22690:93-1046(-)
MCSRSGIVPLRCCSGIAVTARPSTCGRLGASWLSGCSWGNLSFRVPPKQTRSTQSSGWWGLLRNCRGRASPLCPQSHLDYSESSTFRSAGWAPTVRSSCSQSRPSAKSSPPPASLPPPPPDTPPRHWPSPASICCPPCSHPTRPCAPPPPPRCATLGSTHPRTPPRSPGPRFVSSAAPARLQSRQARITRPSPSSRRRPPFAPRQTTPPPSQPPSRRGSASSCDRGEDGPGRFPGEGAGGRLSVEPLHAARHTSVCERHTRPTLCVFGGGEWVCIRRRLRRARARGTAVLGGSIGVQGKETDRARVAKSRTVSNRGN